MRYADTHPRTPRHSKERGSLSIEFAGTMVFVLLMVFFAWQGLLAMHALSQANSAARDAARAESISVGSGYSSGMNALSRSLQPGSSIRCNRSAHTSRVTCQAEVNVPIIRIGVLGDALPSTTINRSATMPIIEAR
ncbi:TadE family protein [Nesterenkonia sp.]|uniref:TadE/TadG family type IV pilus assembly protein n=1 Tax=Nesterenkonia sp. TaxID=704201 RepID=UPI0026135E64|nr:TadE family protein [Nesterenkonia sp.]